jgi:hypothetical protein
MPDRPASCPRTISWRERVWSAYHRAPGNASCGARATLRVTDKLGSPPETSQITRADYHSS